VPPWQGATGTLYALPSGEDQGAPWWALAQAMLRVASCYGKSLTSGHRRLP